MKRLLILLCFLPFVVNGQIRSGVVSSQGVAVAAPSYLTVLNDGNTVAWYKSDEASTITKDGSNLVSQWNDYLGSGRDLLQPTASAQPVWSTSGLLFAGATGTYPYNHMYASFIYVQPEFIYAVIKIFSDNTDYAYIWDGYTSGGDYGGLITVPSATDLHLRSSTASANITTLPLNSFIIIRALYNGASSKLIVNTTSATGNPGTANMGGLFLGAYNLGSFSHIQVKEIIMRKVSDSSGDEATIYAYLKTKYSL
jgi:hypothetical protein